ncbi:MAG: methyltransferase domain-containing protein [Hyphomicrobiaceae bacterium]
MSEILQTHYAKFYADGGWRYDRARERTFLQERIIEPLGLKTSMKIIDLGCGMGLFTSLFHELGFDIVGADMSETGIAHARQTYPGVRYVRADAEEILRDTPPATYDVIFVRGMSWYHYELTSVNKLGVDVPARTRDLFTLLKPGGLFVLQIKTDFTGRRPASGVYHCKVDEFRALFAPLGEIVLLTDWEGTPLETNEDGEKSGKKVIIATRKPL